MNKTILFSLLFFINITTQSYPKLDSLFIVLQKTDKNKREKIRNEIYDYLNFTNDSKLQAHKYVVEKAKLTDDSELYLISKFYLLTRYGSVLNYSFEKKKQIFDSMIDTALSLGYYQIAGEAYLAKAYLFRTSPFNDSSMVYVLKAKNIIEKYGSPKNKKEVEQSIADLYFQSGEIDKAEQIYNQLDTGKFSHVINNNLGLVAIAKRNYKEAKNRFLKTLNEFQIFSNYERDTLLLPYIYRKLTETSILLQDYSEAEKYCSAGINIAQKYKTNFDLVGLYTWQGDILFNNSKIDSALIYLKKAEELEKNYPDFKSKTDLYLVFTKIYESIGSFQEANKYNRLLYLTDSKTDSLNSSKRLINAYAEYNFSNLLKEKNRKEREVNFLTVILAISGISVVLLTLLYLRLRNSNRTLVNKNLSLAKLNEISITTNSIENGSEYENDEINRSDKNSINDDSINDVDSEILDNLSYQLEELIAVEKIYLDTQLNIGKLAEQLKTNKKYLQKAIKKKYNTNFIDFINGLRINEAIKIMSSEEVKNLNMEGIASKSGFNNRVTFTRVFKQVTGVSPSFFLANIQAKY